MVPTPLPYAPRTVGLARGPSIQRRVLAPWLSWGPRGPGIGFVVSDLGRPRVPPQRPARRIARGKRLIGRLVDFQVVRGGLLFRQLGLGVRFLVGHRQPPRVDPRRNMATPEGRERWAGARFRGKTPQQEETHMTNKGAIIAAMAAGLFSAGAPLAASAADSAKVHCQGVNACKGKSACSTATSGCAGQNSCKGKGWIEMSEKDCKAKGGTVAK